MSEETWRLYQELLRLLEAQSRQFIADQERTLAKVRRIYDQPFTAPG